MNADHKVITPEQRWHAGRQAEAFFGLLDTYNKLAEDHLKLQEEIKKLRKAIKVGKPPRKRITTTTAATNHECRI